LVNIALVLVIVAVVGGIFAVSISQVLAADINCTIVVGLCLGTAGNDRMVTTSSGDVIDGNAGNDQISASGGSDLLCGSAGDDKISGGDGLQDLIIGDTQVNDNPVGANCTHTGGSPGADTLVGGPGQDFIFHSDFTNNPDVDKKSDGHRDIIDCGPGSDSVVINISVDHDVATNCESITAG
jgi:Ca2+-binding RTX toxin-like protein